MTHTKKTIALLTLLSAIILTACSFSFSTEDSSSSSDSAADEVDVWLDDTASAVVGQPFDVYVTVDNITDVAHTITSIDVGTEYLASMTLDSTSPAYTKEWDMTAIEIFSYDFGVNLDAGDSQEIVFTFTPTEAGYVSGTFDVCIDTEDNCYGGLIETTVTE